MHRPVTIHLDDTNIKWVSQQAAILQVAPAEIIDRCVTQVSLDGLRDKRVTAAQKWRRRAHNKEFGY